MTSVSLSRDYDVSYFILGEKNRCLWWMLGRMGMDVVGGAALADTDDGVWGDG